MAHLGQIGKVIFFNSSWRKICRQKKRFYSRNLRRKFSQNNGFPIPFSINKSKSFRYFPVFSGEKGNGNSVETLFCSVVVFLFVYRNTPLKEILNKKTFVNAFKSLVYIIQFILMPGGGGHSPPPFFF